MDVSFDSRLTKAQRPESTDKQRQEREVEKELERNSTERNKVRNEVRVNRGKRHGKKKRKLVLLKQTLLSKKSLSQDIPTKRLKNQLPKTK